YSTCSILLAETTHVVKDFLTTHPDALYDPIAATWGEDSACGRFILPGQDNMDGFFYARIIKTN
ncbi:16S rRNA (cytosine(967)-C(5))-methyltransferase RsmB, partial [Acinetobacter baumannii]